MPTFVEWRDAEKTKRIKVLEQEYQDVLDLNKKEYAEAQQEVVENLDTWMRISRASINIWTYFICVTARSWTPRSQ